MAVVELDVNDPRPYVRVATLIWQRIANGELQPGDPTPSIQNLGQEYRHARPTCGKALQLLAGKGLVRCVPGMGYYVTMDARERLAD